MANGMLASVVVFAERASSLVLRRSRDVANWEARAEKLMSSVDKSAHVLNNLLSGKSYRVRPKPIARSLHQNLQRPSLTKKPPKNCP